MLPVALVSDAQEYACRDTFEDLGTNLDDQAKDANN